MISDADIAALLGEDIAGGDVTTETLGFGATPAVMLFRARGGMTLAGVDVARRMLLAAGARTVEVAAADGDMLPPGRAILTATGPAAALHRGWKAAQTLLEVLSGIASATRALVDAVDDRVAVATTRKTVPGARRLSQLAVKAGGGVLHRQGLGETILVFEEHRRFLPDLTLADMAARLRRTQPEKALGIEVASVEEALAAAEAGFEVLQLEKFAPAAVADLVGRLPPPLPGRRRPLIAAAGGIHPGNAGDYVRAGAGLVVTSWPYTQPPRDVAVTLGPA
jgi:molybdenum transport protein